MIRIVVCLERTDFFVSNRLHTKMSKLRREIIQRSIFQEILRQKLGISRNRSNNKNTHKESMLFEETTQGTVHLIKETELTGKCTKRLVTTSSLVVNLGSIDDPGITSNKNRHVELIIVSMDTSMSKKLLSIPVTTTNIGLFPTLESTNLAKIINGNTGSNQIHGSLQLVTISQELIIHLETLKLSILIKNRLDFMNRTILSFKKHITTLSNTNQRSKTLLRTRVGRSQKVFFPIMLEKMITSMILTGCMSSNKIIILRLTINKPRIVKIVPEKGIVDTFIASEGQSRKTNTAFSTQKRITNYTIRKTNTFRKIKIKTTSNVRRICTRR